MAGRRKAEGIALLSVYGGDDDDAASQSVDEDDDDETLEREDVSSQAVQIQENETDSAADAAPRASVPGRVSATAGGLGIVDYAHDEGLAVSPEAKSSPGDSPILQPENVGDDSTLPSTETAIVEEQTSGAVEGEEVPESEAMELDILNDFLPPIPAVKCSGELQTKFAKYLALKKTGKSLNEQLRNTKGYRNPDFLQSAVRHYNIDHIGTRFKKEIFDPHGYEQSDYYDSIALEIRREAGMKEMERRQSQRVDFVRTSIQSAVAVVKPIVPVVHKVVTVSSSDPPGKTDGRSTKKSKWDKVELEGGRTSQAISNAADAIAAASAHAALLTASANAGAGYASFAQQRRREAEEKFRASEKNSLSSSTKSERKTDRS